MNILHLSDIHFSDSITSNALNSEIEELSSAINNWKTDNNQELEYIFVSGDIASKGLKEDYEIADMFFSQLLDKIGLDKKQIFFVPGNHDVCWYKISTKEKEYKKELFNNYTNDTNVEALKQKIYIKDKELLYNKFTFFDEFIAKYSNEQKIYNTLPNQSYSYYHITQLENSVVILINTAILSDETDHEREIFFLAQEQLMDIEKNIGGNQNIILIMHHPLNFLYRREMEYFEQFLCRHNNNLIFCGHYHTPRNEQYCINSTWINECRGAAFSAEDTQEKTFSIYNINYQDNKYSCTKFIKNTNNEWIYNEPLSKSIKYSELTNKPFIQNNSSVSNNQLELENTLLNFIFGDLSVQLDSLEGVYSYLENLFTQNNNEFLQIAEKTFERFNNTPLLCILKNYFVKIIVLHSNKDFNIENCNLLRNSTFLINLFNTLNIVISGFQEYPLEKIEYWLDFIDKYMNIVPQNSRIVISNILRQSLIRINTLENEVSDEK